MSESSALDKLQKWLRESPKLVYLYTATIRDNMTSIASYNRTLDHTEVYEESDIAAQTFSINSQAADKCFDRYISPPLYWSYS